MTDKEILVQLALGTFDTSQLLELVRNTKNPTILTAAAKAFVKLDTIKDDKNTGWNRNDAITNAFRDNKYTPSLVKEYVMIGRQIKHIKRKEKSQWWPPFTYSKASKVPLQENFNKIHRKLFED